MHAVEGAGGGAVAEGWGGEIKAKFQCRKVRGTGGGWRWGHRWIVEAGARVHSGEQAGAEAEAGVHAGAKAGVDEGGPGLWIQDPLGIGAWFVDPGSTGYRMDMGHDCL